MLFQHFTAAETGGITITPLPQSEVKPGFVMKPFLGVEPVLMDEQQVIWCGTCNLVYFIPA